jgi:3-phenylpropionate/trans-cinnamate dioxygenase ferredoxin reductase component
VIFRRYTEPGQMIIFWLHEQRIQAGMNINIWDVAEEIERLVQSAQPINADELADPAVPLARLM